MHSVPLVTILSSRPEKWDEEEDPDEAVDSMAEGEWDDYSADSRQCEESFVPGLELHQLGLLCALANNQPLCPLLMN